MNPRGAFFSCGTAIRQRVLARLAGVLCTATLACSPGSTAWSQSRAAGDLDLRGDVTPAFLLRCVFCDRAAARSECARTFPPSYFAKLPGSDGADTYAFFSPAFGKTRGKVRGVWGKAEPKKRSGNTVSIVMEKPRKFRGPDVRGVLLVDDRNIMVTGMKNRRPAIHAGICEPLKTGSGD